MRTAIRMRAGGRADASSFLGCRPAVAVCQSDWAGQDAGPAMSAMPVRRGKAALSSGCKSHPATAPAGSNRSSHGGDEMAEAFG